jgi:hypothetical protein
VKVLTRGRWVGVVDEGGGRGRPGFVVVDDA